MSNPSKRHEEKALALMNEIYLCVGNDDDEREPDSIIATALASAEAELLREMMEPSAELLSRFHNAPLPGRSPWFLFDVLATEWDDPTIREDLGLPPRHDRPELASDEDRDFRLALLKHMIRAMLTAFAAARGIELEKDARTPVPSQIGQ